MSVLDITRACHVRELLEFYQTNIDVTQPVSGHVYCSTGAGVRRRVSVSPMLINVILTVRCPLSVLCNVLVVLALFLAHQNQI